MAALGELRRRGAKAHHRPPARGPRPVLIALAALAAVAYLSKPSSTLDKRLEQYEKRQRQAELQAQQAYGQYNATGDVETCVEVAIMYFACDADALERLLANHAAYLKGGGLKLKYTLAVSQQSLACARLSKEAARLGARFDVEAESVMSIDAYSRILTAPAFWERRPCAFTLITQLDVTACPLASRTLRDYVGPFDYVGGITDRLKRRWKHVAPYHLNGGFSLRRVSAMRRCALLYNSTLNWPEDYVFVTCPGIKLAPPSIADGFALDNGNRKPSPTSPLALHKPFGMRSKGRSRLGAAAVKACGLQRRLSLWHSSRTDVEKAKDQKHLSRHPLFTHEKGPGELLRRWPDNTIEMVVSGFHDDLGWLHKVQNINIQTHVYWRPGASLVPTNNQHRLPVNRGDEAAAYFKYLSDFYETLPQYVIFAHGHEYAYHAPTSTYRSCLLNLPAVVDTMGGFASLNHDKHGKTVRKFSKLLMPQPQWSAELLERTLDALYLETAPPPLATPTELSFPASAQFVVSRANVRRRPRAFYERAYNLSIAATPAACRGRTCAGYLFENQYHYIFGRAWDFNDGAALDYARWKVRLEP